MSFLRELVSLRSTSLENPTRPLTDTSLLEALGGAPSDTGISASPDSAMRIGAALRGVSIIAGAVAGLPFKAYRRADHTEFLGSALSSDTGPYTDFELWETSVAHMVSRGFAALFKIRDRRGSITGLFPVHPGRVGVQVEDDPVGGGRAFDLVFTIDGKGPFTRYDVLYIPALSLDGITGLGPIGYARETFNLALANEKAAAKLFGQGMLQRGFLTTDQDIDNEKAERLKTRWRAKMSGLDNAHDVAIMDNGAKFNQLTLDPDDAQFLESRKFQVTEIARVLGIPGWMLNDQEKSTSWGTGMEQQFATFVKLTLKPYLQRIEQRVTRELLPSSAYAEFNVEGLLRGDSKARAAFYNAGITGGWLVPNEVRERENLQPVEWGDEPYRPYNQSAADQTSADTEDDTSGSSKED